MPRYVVHIGPHKTGSTYLQTRFIQLRPRLKSSGVIHPAIWQEDGEVSHVGLFRRLRARDPRLTPEFAVLNRSSYEFVVLSSEDLIDLTTDQVGQLATLLDGRPVDIVFYCRRWSELLISGWAEKVKHGEVLPLPEYLAEAAINPFSSEVLNFRLRLDRFAGVFGRDCLHLVSYNHLGEQDYDLFEHFARRFLGQHELPALPPERLNTSLDAVDTETIRILQVLHRSRAGAADMRLAAEYLRSRHLPDARAVNDAMRHDLRCAYLDEDGPGFASLHRELFGEYGDRLVAPRPEGVLFKPKATSLPFVGQDYLLTAGVLAAIERLYGELTSRVERERPPDPVERPQTMSIASPTAISPPVTTSA